MKCHTEAEEIARFLFDAEQIQKLPTNHTFVRLIIVIVPTVAAQPLLYSPVPHAAVVDGF